MARPQLNIVTLDFIAGDPGQMIIDIPRALSLYNRKSYRSGYVYSVDYIEYIGTANDIITIAKLPTTYGLLAGYKTAFKLWREQRAATIENTGIEPGKWSDFKPYYNQEHLIAGGVGGWPELLPKGMGAGLLLQDLDTVGAEWNRAEIVTNDFAAATTATYFVGMLGDDDITGGYVSVMDGYGDTRSPTLSPDPLVPQIASSSWMTMTGEESREMAVDVIDLVESENDQPPYANQPDITLPPTYVGNGQSATYGIMVDTATVGSTGRSVTLDGGLIPLGLLAISTAGVGSGTIRVHLTRGTYKGVAALPMGDFR